MQLCYSLDETDEKSLIVHLFVRETADFIFYDEYSRSKEGLPLQKFCGVMLLKEKLWFAKEPYQIFAEFGITIDKKRSYELEALFDGRLSGYYYLEAASDGTEEAAKWLLGAIAAHLNEKKINFDRIGQVFPPDYLKAFVVALKKGKMERTFSKEVCAEILSKGEQFIDSVRRTGEEVLSEILANPKYKAASSNEIDTIIDEILAANPDNVAKVKEQPKLVQWFVGQVMKASKGKASAPVVLEKIKTKLQVD
jgi:Asp-tRNA(Asn)/Glu-tRNA(Gln) amidotransferase B subunit